MSKRRMVGAKLRPGLDDDIAAALDALGEGEYESDIVRRGVRIALGLTTEKVMEIRERRLVPPRLFMLNLNRRREDE